MQSILINGKDKEKVREKAKDLCKENKISKFDIEIVETEKSVGIGEIRNLQQKIFLKPLESKTKAVILEAFFGMTTESQNAFLKVLEEPPAHAKLMILVSSLDFILPTIFSRCNLINLDQVKKLTREEVEQNLKIISDLKKGGIGKALKIAQDNSKDRETALDFLENLIVSVENSIGGKEFADSEFLKILKALQKTYTIIKTANVNPRFALENLFLNF
jgi:DNA polymerase III gamma/tau subunit